MYLTSEAIRFLMKDKENDLNKDDVAALNAYKGSLDAATKFIPTWVKIAVALERFPAEVNLFVQMGIP
jgi:PiT family inorganic phosphate transporter